MGTDADPDGDGLTNWEEYLSGTHPNDAASVLQIQRIAVSGGNVILEFMAVSNRTYSVLYKPALDAAQWSSLVQVPAQPASRLWSVTNSTLGEAVRFYRLVTPAQP